MNERICRLRQHSLRATPCLSPERAVLMTEFYKSGAAERVSTRIAKPEASGRWLDRVGTWFREHL